MQLPDGVPSCCSPAVRRKRTSLRRLRQHPKMARRRLPAGAGCRASLLPLHLSPSFLTCYLFTKKRLGETRYYSFSEVSHKPKDNFPGRWVQRAGAQKRGEMGGRPFNHTFVAPGAHLTCQDGALCLLRVSSASRVDVRGKTDDGGLTLTVPGAKLLSASLE